MIDLILGTAGHIDHGKTSLIKALTGVDTDRLPEEKKRGITIELGFAELVVGDFRLGIVDVPGHERFVRQMLAGATSMDLAMLVVAADDSVKQQTREHLEVLRLLDLPAGVLVLTKCDLPDSDWIDLVEEEVRDLVSDSFLAQAPLVRTSAATGAGLSELKEALCGAAQIAARVRGNERAMAPFRMAIDRTFVLEGHGTVVTGSVATGTTRVGDQLMLVPGNVEVRVRSLQNHDRAVDEVHGGQRAAINLAGVHHDQVARGHELCTPGFLLPSQLLTARVEVVPDAHRPLKHRQRVRLHLGTAEVMTSVSLLSRTQLAPGEAGMAQLFLGEPAVASWNQPFVLRSESPVQTIGGGRVLVPCAHKLRHSEPGVDRALQNLMSTDPLERAAGAIYFAGTRPWQPRDLARTAGVSEAVELSRRLNEQGTLVTLKLTPQRSLLLHRDVCEELAARLEGLLKKMHEREPLRLNFDVKGLVSQLAYLAEPPVLEALLERMHAAGRVRISPRGVSLVGQGPKLSQGEQKLYEQLVQTYREAGFHVPTVKEVQQGVTKNRQAVAQLLTLAAASGDLVEISAELYLHADVEAQVRESLRTKLANSQGMTLSEIREFLETSRKYAVPFCEYLDRIGFTQRQGDLRLLK